MRCVCFHSMNVSWCMVLRMSNTYSHLPVDLPSFHFLQGMSVIHTNSVLCCHLLLLLPLALQPAVGFGLSNNTSPFFPYLSPNLSIFSLPALEDLFLLLLSILSWIFLFISSLPVLQWRSFWASCPPPFSPGGPTNLSFAPLSILLYFLPYSTLLVLDSSYFSIPHLHI